MDRVRKLLESKIFQRKWTTISIPAVSKKLIQFRDGKSVRLDGRTLLLGQSVQLPSLIQLNLKEKPIFQHKN